MRVKKILLTGLSLLILTSCSVFSPVKIEPENTYVLDRTPSVAKRATHNVTLLVNYPQASAVYNTTQMAYSTHVFEIAYFAKNRWADTPAHMLQPLMVQTLQNTHYFRQVMSPGMLGQYHYVLNSQLLHMEQIFFGQSSQMHIVLEAQIVDVMSGRVMATKQFSIDEPAAPAPYGGVVAANRGVAKLLAQLAQFVVTTIPK